VTVSAHGFIVDPPQMFEFTEPVADAPHGRRKRY
jgi:hypothetical protein